MLSVYTIRGISQPPFKLVHYQGRSHEFSMRVKIYDFDMGKEMIFVNLLAREVNPKLNGGLLAILNWCVNVRKYMT
jgi:hypothetical protein